MTILLIDTTSTHCYVAVVTQDKVFDATILHCNTSHSERLCGAVDNALQLAGCTFDDIDCYAVGIGTGSFTGIRIGISTVLGYNRAKPATLIALPTLLMLSVHSGNSKVAQDSGNGYYYCQYDNWDSDTNAQLIQYDCISTDCYLFDKETNYIDSLVKLARYMYNNGKFFDTLTPLYIRRSQAEIEYDKKNNIT